MKKDLVSRMDESKLTHLNYQLCKGVVIRDSLLESNGKNYVCDENIDAYYILTNTWLNIMSPFERTAYLVREQILDKGLIPVIEDCSNAADCVVHDMDITIDYLGELNQYRVSQIREVLQVLRYPKRLSPVHCDGLERSSISQFKTVANEVKLQDRVCLSNKMVQILARASEILRPLGRFSAKEAELSAEFSSGATAGHSHTIVSRVCEAVEQYPEHFFPYTNTNHFREDRDFVARVNSQPKSFKARRIICMEDSGRNFFLSGLRKVLWQRMQVTKVPGYEYTFDKVIPLEDQEINQMLAYVGSLDASYATLDFSNASDRISAGLARQILPRSIVTYIDRFRAGTLQYEDGKTQDCYMWLPSGNTITFLCESLIFFAVVLATCEYAHLWIEDTPDVYVYGDDTIIRSAYYDTVADVVTRLGWRLNGTKSYYQGGTFVYREACGHEYLNGFRCDTHYFPRKSVSVDSKGLPKLVDLQHRLYDFSWRATEWLTALIRHQWPQMTTSPRSEDLATDLWGSATPTYRKVPYAYFTTDMVKKGYWVIPVRRLHSCEVEPHMMREWHAAPKSLPDGKIEVYGDWTEQEEREQYDLYCYRDFLQNGPRYLSELDKLLGVSEPRIPFNLAARQITSRYSF